MKTLLAADVVELVNRIAGRATEHSTAERRLGEMTACDDILAALEALPDAQGWLPIDEKAKDGSKVVTCILGLYPVDVKLNFFSDPARSALGMTLGGEGWWDSSPNRPPTHYFPLPPSCAHKERV